MLQRRLESTRALIAEVDLFISPSRFMRNKFLEFGVPAHKIMHCPHGIPQGTVSVENCTPPYRIGGCVLLDGSTANPSRRDALGNPLCQGALWPGVRRKRALRFGFVGTLLPMKGIDVLLAAFKELEYKEIELLIFGKLLPYAGYEGYMHVLRKTARKDSRIRLMGDFDHEDVGKVFSGIDVLVVPSIWPENWPLVIAEAFLYKTPVVASRIGGIPELIEDGKNGLLFNAGDAHDLKDKLRHLIEDLHLLSALKNTVTKVKTIEEHTIEIEQAYARLIEKSLAVV